MTQYYIKMDLNNWLGIKCELIDGKTYEINKNFRGIWCFADEDDDIRKCVEIAGWGVCFKLNTSIAYTKDTPVATDKNLLVEVILENIIKITEANPASSAHCDLIIEAVEELTK